MVPILGVVLAWIKGWQLNFDKRRLVTFISFLILFNFITVLTLFTSVVNYQSQYSDQAINEIYRADTQQITEQYNIIDTLAGYGTYGWNNQLADENPGWQAFAIFNELSAIYLVTIGL